MWAPEFPRIPSPWNDESRRVAARALQDNVYGPCPAVRPVPAEVVAEVGDNLELVRAPFPVLVAKPSIPGPWPVLLGVSFHGLRTLHRVPALRLPEPWSYPRQLSRKGQPVAWPLARITDAGWAVAVVFVGDIEPDDAELSKGLAISKWAHGLRAIAGSLAKDERFDARRIVAIGHSRLGKTALLAAAMDDGFAGCVALQSGCGGAAPSRTEVGETVADITRVFPHWFTRSFAAYADHPETLPLDQHWLLALCASRPLLLCNAQDDVWANPVGQHHMLRLAAEAFGEGLPEMKLGATVGGRLAHFYRPGRHQVIEPDWDAILPWLAAQFPTAGD